MGRADGARAIFRMAFRGADAPRWYENGPLALWPAEGGNVLIGDRREELTVIGSIRSGEGFGVEQHPPRAEGKRRVADGI